MVVEIVLFIRSCKILHRFMHMCANSGGLWEHHYRKQDQCGSLITKIILTRLKYLVAVLWNTGEKKKGCFLVKGHLVIFSQPLFLISPNSYRPVFYNLVESQKNPQWKLLHKGSKAWEVYDTYKHQKKMYTCIYIHLYTQTYERNYYQLSPESYIASTVLCCHCMSTFINTEWQSF